jgi:hypothetical protein
MEGPIPVIDETQSVLDPNLLILLGFGGLALLLVYSLWQASCVAWMRQTCFEARASIFLLAADGKLEFCSREYREIRGGIETLIRFAERISWPRLLAYQVVGVHTRSMSSLSSSAARIQDREVRTAVLAQIDRVSEAVWFLLIWRSPLLLIASSGLYLARFVSRSIDGVRRTIVEQIKIEAEEGSELVGRSATSRHTPWVLGR